MFFKRHNKNIQALLAEKVHPFETKYTSQPNAIKYWGSFFSTTDIGRLLRGEIQNVLGERDESGDIGRCSEFVLYILQNFDHFKSEHTDLYFPVKNLGRCRINGFDKTGKNMPIPHYKFITGELLSWDYHEIIVIINDEDLYDSKNLISNSILDNAKIFDIGMNTKFILDKRGFFRDLVHTGAGQSDLAKKYYTPDNLMLDITHRYSGVLVDKDSWSNLKGKSICIPSSWFRK